MQSAFSQRGNQAGVVAVTLDRSPATGQHDPGMPNVGPGQLHAVFTSADDSQHARNRSRRNGRSGSPALRREAAALPRLRRGADQGRSHRRQLHRHLLPVRAVPARAALRARDRGVRHGGRGRRGRDGAAGRRPGGDRGRVRRLRRILHRAGLSGRWAAADRRLRRGGLGAAEGDDRALLDQVGLPGAAGGHGAGARRRRRGGADLDPVGLQPGRPGDHDGVDAGQGRAVPAGRRHRCAGLPRATPASSAGASAI